MKDDRMIMREEIAIALPSFLFIKKIVKFKDNHFLSIWLIIAKGSGLNYICNTVYAPIPQRQAT